MKKQPEMKARIKLWLESDEGKVLIGEGRASLLDSIAQTGSITAAARATGMSYRTAWHLVNSMNSAFPQPIVQTIVGGKGGGNARLTPLGELALREFFELRKGLMDYLIAGQISSKKALEGYGLDVQ